MLYTALYMAATRTQIYLTEEQRERLDELAGRRAVSMATVVRDAIDAYLGEAQEDVGVALDETFGSIPTLEVPSRAEWRGSDGRMQRGTRPGA
jgi:predicted DNA-binding protein